MRKFIIIFITFLITTAKAKIDYDANFVRYASIGVSSMITRGDKLYNGVNVKYGKNIINLQNFIELSAFFTIKAKEEFNQPTMHLGIYYSHFFNYDVEVNNGFYVKTGFERGTGNAPTKTDDIKPTRIKFGGGYEIPFNYYDFKKSFFVEFLINPTIKFMEIGVFVKYKFDS